MNLHPGVLLLFSGLASVTALAAALRSRNLWLTGTLTAAIAALGAAVRVLATGAAWDWQSGLEVGGAPVHLRLDGVSALFLALIAVLGGAASLYSTEYWNEQRHPKSAPSGRVWWTLLLLSMGLIVIEANGLHFLIAWELFAVSGYFLITGERCRREVRAAGWLYFAASHAGTLCLFAFFAGLAARTGSWELGPMPNRSELAPLFWLALVGFGLKAGFFPLHVWLPSAHANAPSHVSAILSGVALKMGVYGLVRFSGWLPLPEGAGWVVAAAGAVSSVLGVVFALAQHDLKRLLAYHSVENIGIILIGLGFAMIAATHGQPAWGRLALAGGLLHVWNHGLFKGLLFLGAGSVLHATGTRTMSRLGGLWRNMPWTAGLFALGSAAICGLPPLNGFVSEWLIYLGLFDALSGPGTAVWAAVFAAVALALTGALALACFVKVCGVVFLGLPRSAAAQNARECGPPMRGGMLALAAGCLAIGLAPVLFWPALETASSDWMPSWTSPSPDAPLFTLGVFHLVLAALAILAGAGLVWRLRRNGVARAGTWDCGFAAPTPRMQYTAGSFAGIITEWFAWILQPHRLVRPPEGPFPKSSEFAEHTPETVLEKVIEPASSIVMRVSTAARRLQHGRLQAYVVYLLLGMVALSLVVWMAGGSR
jgi:hydrogenase-4 component B